MAATATRSSAGSAQKPSSTRPKQRIKPTRAQANRELHDAYRNHDWPAFRAHLILIAGDWHFADVLTLYRDREKVAEVIPTDTRGLFFLALATQMQSYEIQKTKLGKRAALEAVEALIDPASPVDFIDSAYRIADGSLRHANPSFVKPTLRRLLASPHFSVRYTGERLLDYAIDDKLIQQDEYDQMLAETRKAGR